MPNTPANQLFSYIFFFISFFLQLIIYFNFPTFIFTLIPYQRLLIIFLPYLRPYLSLLAHSSYSSQINAVTAILWEDFFKNSKWVMNMQEHRQQYVNVVVSECPQLAGISLYTCNSSPSWCLNVSISWFSFISMLWSLFYLW